MEPSQQLKPSLKLRPSLSLPASQGTTLTTLQLIIHLHPADHRAKSVVSEYKSRFQNLDKHCAPDVIVGDGNGGITAPFESGYFVVMKKLPMHNMIT